MRMYGFHIKDDRVYEDQIYGRHGMLFVGNAKVKEYLNRDMSLVVVVWV